MQATANSTLKEALQTVLLTDLKQRGFVQLPLSEDDAASPEIREAFPFGRLRRRLDGGYEQIEIQIDRRSRSAFRLNMGVVPDSGIAHTFGHVAEADVWVHYLDTFSALYEFAWTRRWFAVRTGPNGNADLESQALARRVVSLWPEIQAALAGRPSTLWSTHIRRVRA